MRAAAFRAELSKLFSLALPLAAAQAGTQLMSVVDIAVLGRFGARELAGAGLANAVFFAFAIAGTGVVLGIDPMISQALGAGDRVRARELLWQGIWLSLAVSGVLTIVILAASAAIPFMGVEEELVAPAVVYLIIRAIGLAPQLVFLVLRAYLQALAVTRAMIVSMVITNVFNFAADVLLVFGGGILPEWCGPLRLIPRLGVAGAAIATVAGTLLQLAILAGAIRGIDVPIRSRRWNTSDVRQGLRVGLPVGLQLAAEVGIFALVGVMAARIGTLALAAHQLVLAIAAFTYTVALGVAAAGSVRVGLAVGARDVTGTRAAGDVAFAGGAGVMAVAAALFLAFPETLARIVTNQEAVIRAAIPLFLVAAVFQLSDGIQAVGSGVLRGAGDTRFAFVANIIGHWVIGFPIALLLGFGLEMGIAGLWWGLCAGLTVVAALLFIRFQRLSSREIVPIEE